MDGRLIELPCGYMALDHNSTILEVNDTFLRWMGYDEGQLQGHHIESLLKQSNRIVFHSYFYPNIHLYGYIEELFIKMKHVSDEEIPFLMNAKQTMRNGQQIIDCVFVQMKKRINYELELRQTKLLMEDAYFQKEQAFARLEQIYKEIEQKQLELMEINSGLIALSNTDKLTGVPNRRYFQERIEGLIEKYHEEGTHFSLLIIDIDHFKKVNDTYGHQTGDVVLVKLATILRQGVVPPSFVARFGGEEFVVLLPNFNEEEALQVAGSIRAQVETASWVETGGLTVSVGAATFSSVDTEQTIISKADQALYASKENGRNQATHYRSIT